MKRTTSPKWIFRAAAAALAVAAIGIAVSCKSSNQPPAQSNAQATYKTPADAGQALLAAAKAQDDKALSNVLGPDSPAILSSGDANEDKAGWTSFAEQYGRMNRWVAMTDGSQVLYIGAENYPFPIPLAKNAAGQWYFNTAAGRNEMLARRIGRNELLAIDAVNAIGTSEQTYLKSAHQYTQKIISTPGQKDGLYWTVKADEPPSPLGRVDEFAKDAIAAAASGGPTEFDGYTFRILTAQGAAAKGGAKTYLTNDKLTGGFAVLATPVKYGDSGIMTFMMSREGVVYQKDLGPNTAQAAAAITSYDPGDGWEKAE